ncbi:MAG: hypothetical protein CVT49_10935 [candidate division Zixibacteria bacterium HGW-Zixibacteria-1]|nr:MAG: hypothetical protein CVT49_10935 [candidate division Zixibacteria bacterium HGW-Zixibacteria-1]
MERRKIERHAPREYIMVYDDRDGRPLGKLINLSTDGAMFITDGPIKPTTILQCRVKLKEPILGHDKIYFAAECRWCRKNVAAGHWESGYHLQVSGIEADLISYMVLGFKLCDWGDEDLPDVKTTEMENRRKSVRFEFDGAFPVYEFRGYRQLGTLADISIEGIRIFTEKRFDRDEIFRCRIKLPRKVFQQDFLVLEARCMWCRKQKGVARYESGHMLLNTSKEDLAIILHLLIYYARPQRTKRKILIAE